MRVGIIMLYHESNTFMDEPVTLDSFRQDTLLTADAIREAFEVSHHELGGFFVGLHKAGIEAVPIVAARANPAGVITNDAYEFLVARIFERLNAVGPLNGLLVAPHGAAVCQAARDMDGDWLRRLRTQVGPQLPIISTLDPHANLSAQMVDATDAIIAYRTNPHLDQHARGLEAAALMARTIKREVQPVQRSCHLPMVISIDRQNTDEEPCLSVCRFAEEVRQRSGVLAVTTVLGFPYADVDEMGSSFAVTTDRDPAMAQAYANELGDYLWQHREVFAPNLIETEYAVAQIANSPKAVLLLDLGDNIGGGTAGDGTLIAHELLKVGESWRKAFICLCDPQSVRQAYNGGPGAELVMQLGGKTALSCGEPIAGKFTVRSFHDGRFDEPAPRHSAYTQYDMGLTAVVESSERLTIMLTTRPTMPFSLCQLTSCGIDPTFYDAIVAKGAQAPIAAYKEVCQTIIRVNTPGISSADLNSLSYKYRKRPMFPFD